jgi:hypothetical protein
MSKPSKGGIMFLVLPKDTQAAQIHGKTKQHIADCILPKDTQYEPIGAYQDALGTHWLRIVVDGYHYQILLPKED